MKFVKGRVENIVGKGENAGPAFCPFLTKFSKVFFLKVVRSRDCVVKTYVLYCGEKQLIFL